MKYQKSPLPYLTLLVIIISAALYSTTTIDKKINQPLVYTIESIPEHQRLASDVSTENLISKASAVVCIDK
ncbi:MAG: hypothetical protein HRU50_06680 [Winogradskyella sp.]|uniref:hypothetical protein n=1 Tax=Winogradskyella sp. TaxID=1883156 RepID=UPI0025D11312|nr:hypothetical protein [Winogradskyella sp.]NRB59616.1 hypothetical protein [Winogradskyella sp.]